MILLAYGFTRDPREIRSPLIGKRVPSFTLRDRGFCRGVACSAWLRQGVGTGGSGSPIRAGPLCERSGRGLSLPLLRGPSGQGPGKLQAGAKRSQRVRPGRRSTACLLHRGHAHREDQARGESRSRRDCKGRLRAMRYCGGFAPLGKNTPTSVSLLRRRVGPTGQVFHMIGRRREAQTTVGSVIARTQSTEGGLDIQGGARSGAGAGRDRDDRRNRPLPA